MNNVFASRLGHVCMSVCRCRRTVFRALIFFIRDDNLNYEIRLMIGSEREIFLDVYEGSPKSSQKTSAYLSNLKHYSLPVNFKVMTKFQNHCQKLLKQPSVTLIFEHRSKILQICIPTPIRNT